jgi:predicted PurR-regulated permease PerM
LISSISLLKPAAAGRSLRWIPSSEGLSLSTAKAIGIVAGIALALALVVLIAQILLLVFAGILLAIVLRSIANGIDAVLGIGRAWSLTLALSAVVLTVALGSWLLLPDIVAQGQQLADQLPRGWDALRQRLSGLFGNTGLIDLAFDRAASPSRGAMQDIVGGVFGVVSGTLGILGSGLVILFTGIYLAADPQTYRDGLIRLIPPAHRDRAQRLVDEIDRVLLWWLIGKLIEMALIGVLTYLGLWALGMPLALSLAMIAALLTFVPNFGPIIAAAPAVLIALGDGLNQAALVMSLYVAVQAVESYLITPLIQQRTISMPPALTLAMQLVAAVLLGILGLALATPLTAAGIVLVRELYVKGLLERDGASTAVAADQRLDR